MIRERVCRIVATRDEAPVAAAVRFDTSTDKLGGMLLHDAPLPRLEHHWSALLVLLLGERLGFSLLLGLFLRLHALVRAADPLVDVLDPGRQVPLVGLEDQGLMHHPEAPGMTQDRGLGRLREEPGPLTRRCRAELDGPGELVALEI